MESKSEVINLKRYLPHVFAVTFIIAALPLLAVYLFERSLGFSSPVASAFLGIALSLSVAIAGSALWRKFGTTDLVFADLLLWGYLRRVWVDRRLAQMTRRFRLQEKAAVADRMAPEARAKMLSDLAALIEASDPYTHGHSRRVTRHAYMIAKTMGLPKEVVDKVRLAAAVHDVGKIYTPKNILHKPDRLTDEEFEIIKEHPVTGAEMVAILGDEEVTAMVRHHHERLDGRGYPDRLAGDEIPIGARVIAVADTFDAICSTRPYRPASRHLKAIDIMKKEAGKQLDAGAVHAFLRYYSGRSSVGWWASLTTVPQRLVSYVVSWVQQTTMGAAVQGAAAVVSSVALVTGIPVVTTIANTGVAAAEERSVEQSSSSRTSGTAPLSPKAGSLAESTNSSGGSDSGSNESASGDSSSGSRVEPSPSPTSDSSSSSNGEPRPEPSPSPTATNSGSDPTPSPTTKPSPSPTPSPSPSPSPTSIIEDVVDDVIDILF